ncbi:hypothetical protein [Maledivibacter halophilus]|nr:hypothetical protein [Maledivibacter halophilus]
MINRKNKRSKIVKEISIITAFLTEYLLLKVLLKEGDNLNKAGRAK